MDPWKLVNKKKSEKQTSTLDKSRIKIEASFNGSQ